jgi:hypothetical protein
LVAAKSSKAEILMVLAAALTTGALFRSLMDFFSRYRDFNFLQPTRVF